MSQLVDFFSPRYQIRIRLDFMVWSWTCGFWAANVYGISVYPYGNSNQTQFNLAKLNQVYLFSTIFGWEITIL